jgi:hypothetical protein
MWMSIVLSSIVDSIALSISRPWPLHLTSMKFASALKLDRDRRKTPVFDKIYAEYPAGYCCGLARSRDMC